MSNEVLAAGGIVVDQLGRVVVVHRPRRNDWSLPKGKCEDGETDQVAARREVFEETGVLARIIEDQESVEVRYVDGRGRLKRVRYFRMAGQPGAFQPNDEVDELRWLDPTDAREILTYDSDRAVLDATFDGSQR